MSVLNFSNIQARELAERMLAMRDKIKTMAEQVEAERTAQRDIDTDVEFHKRLAKYNRRSRFMKLLCSTPKREDVYRELSELYDDFWDDDRRADKIHWWRSFPIIKDGWVAPSTLYQMGLAILKEDPEKGVAINPDSLFYLKKYEEVTIEEMRTW